MATAQIKQKVVDTVNNVRYYWKEPPRGKYMNFREIAAYSIGGIGAYFLIVMGSNLLVSTTNMIVGGAIGVGPTDMYIMYVISTLASIPLTGIRATMVDNTRGKAGKYRPYLLSMGLPTAIIAVVYVWFPYDKLGLIVGQGEIFGKSKAYVATCAIVMLFNLLLQFFFNFFNDAYTNLIHVLSPDTQERTNVLSIKSVVYSLAPSIINIVLPLVAQFFANNNMYDIKVYRLSYPIFAVLGMGLTIIVYANTREKIVQAKTHTIQISFMDSLKAVAKNKYFWIIALAGWVGFLEGAYGSILQWSFNYAHTCNGATFALINTLTGNASLWGMLLAPFCIKKFGKKKVLIFVNAMNVICILAMRLNMQSIWWLFICVYFNWLVGAFEQITGPAIQADIRDYQQYKTGERIDGMFAAVSTIGNVVTLLTSAVLPAVQEHYGVFEGNGYAKPYDILDVTTGQPGLLYKLMGALILMAALGAFMNMVPYFFYDFSEFKQKCVIRVLQVRSLFEDYSNNALGNRQIVEAIDLINSSREMAASSAVQANKPKKRKLNKKSLNLDDIDDKKERKAVIKSAKKEIKAEYKQAKKDYKAKLEFNEEIEIGKFVCDELDKFSSPVFIREVEISREIYAAGYDGIKNLNISECKGELKNAKKLPKKTKDEKEIRRYEIDMAKYKISAKKSYDSYFKNREFEVPNMDELTRLFDLDDELDLEITKLAADLTAAKKAKDNTKENEIKAEIDDLKKKKKDTENKSKTLQDEFAKFNRTVKPYNEAKKLLAQQENFSHFEEISALYDEAKAKADEEDRIKDEETRRRLAQEKADLEAKKAQKELNSRRRK